MDAKLIDPRDISWEADQRVYRAYFEDEAGTTEEWEISDADLAQVLAWTTGSSRGRAHSLYAYVECGQQPGLLRLMSQPSQAPHRD